MSEQVQAPPQRFLHRYNLEFPVRLSRTQLEQWCFVNHLSTEQGGMGRYRHFKEFASRIWPNLEWNPWLREQIKELCSDENAVRSGDVYVKTVAMTGSGAAGKSFSAGLFAAGWWRCDPEDSAVIVCSTTKDMLKKRVWHPISDFHVTAIDDKTKKLDPMGRLIDSRTKIVWDGDGKADDKHGIFGIAVAGGETQKAVQHIKGIHANRIMVIVDEAEATPEAIMEAIPNLRKGCREFILVVLGNSVSRLDPHGLVCAPADGWDSVSVESDSWATAGVPRWQIEPGICLHFDGTKSPNVKNRRTLYPYLYSWEDYLAAQNRPDYQLSMAFWQHDRGFWPPEGLADRIFTEQLIEKYGAGTDREPFEFLSLRLPVAFLDSAFGGDNAQLVFGLLGDLPTGGKGLQVTEHKIISLTAKSKDEIDYELARKVMEQCKLREVMPAQFGSDATGIGRGVHAILAGEWSTEIQRVEGTGAPTDRPASTADGRPAKEVYDRFSTEIWWSGREVLQAGQLRGLYRDAIVQMCARSYTMIGRKYSIETKEKFKGRLGRSPDDADAVLGLIEVARRNGLTMGTTVAKRQDRDWEKTLREADQIHSDEGVFETVYDDEEIYA